MIHTIFKFSCIFWGWEGGVQEVAERMRSFFLQKENPDHFLSPPPSPSSPSLRRCYIILCISSFYRIAQEKDRSAAEEKDRRAAQEKYRSAAQERDRSAAPENDRSGAQENVELNKL